MRSGFIVNLLHALLQYVASLHRDDDVHVTSLPCVETAERFVVEIEHEGRPTVAYQVIVAWQDIAGSFERYDKLAQDAWMQRIEIPAPITPQMQARRAAAVAKSGLPYSKLP